MLEVMPKKVLGADMDVTKLLGTDEMVNIGLDIETVRKKNKFKIICLF